MAELSSAVAPAQPAVGRAPDQSVVPDSRPVQATQVTPRKPRIGILVVAYNAESTLRGVLHRIPEAIVDKIDEIFVFDDASQDATHDVGKACAEELPKAKLSVFKNPVNLMYGGNQARGYMYAMERGLDIVVLLHGDGQYAPEVMQDLLTPLETGAADMVMGSRMMVPGAALRGNMPMYKYVGNKVLTWFENTMAGTKLTEFHSGYRAYSVDALRKVPLGRLTYNWHFDTQIILEFLKYGFRIKEVPIPTYYGDEICHVNGIPYAMNCAAEATKYAALHRWKARHVRRGHGFNGAAGAGPAGRNERTFQDVSNASHTRGDGGANAGANAGTNGTARSESRWGGAAPPAVPSAPVQHADARTVHYRPHQDPRSSHQQISRRVRDLRLSPILDVGAAQGMLGHSLQGAGLTIDGVELNPTWADMARPYYRDVWASTIEAAPLPDNTYRLIACADVLEHTVDPVAVLRRLRRAGTEDCVFIVSVPNVAHLAVRMLLLFGLFPKMQRGPLDRTHLHFFTRGTARDMVESAGLRVRRITCTGVPLDEVWKGGEGSLLYRTAIKAQHLALALRPPMFGFQWILEARA